MLAGVNLAPQDANVSTMRFAIMYSGGMCSANRHAPFYNVYNGAYRLLYSFDAFSFFFFILKKRFAYAANLQVTSATTLP